MVGTRVGGIPCQIKDGKTGFLVKPEDYETAAERVGWLMEHPQEAREMGKAAHQYIAENFLITNNLLGWLRLINSLR